MPRKFNLPAEVIGASAVTDTQGRVRGVSGLRVVDASLFPVVPRADRSFPTLMTAEKIADAILAAA